MADNWHGKMYQRWSAQGVQVRDQARVYADRVWVRAREYAGRAGARLAVGWHRLAHARWVRRLGLVALTLFLLFSSLVVWTWNTTPSAAGLVSLVHHVDAAHNDPYTPYAAIAPTVSRALIAAEDEHFYQNHGIDVVSLTRALWDDLRYRRLLEGGSTITEQLAKNAYLNDDDHTPWLKWQDIILAVKVEQRYSKQQILELYLNLVYFGDGSYGIGAASQHYFGMPPSQLDLARSAVLAGLVRAPSFYDPFCNPQATLARQQFVLSQMLADGMISPPQAQAAAHEAAGFWPNGPKAGDRFCNG